MGLPKGTGTLPMELEFPAVVSSRISTEPEVRWWYVWTANEVERMGSTAVRYLIRWTLPRTYPLECTQHAGVSDIVCRLLFCSTPLQCLHVLQKSGSHIALLCILNKLDYSLSVLYRGSSIVCLKKGATRSNHCIWLSWSCMHSKIGLTITSATEREGAQHAGAVCPRPLV